MYAIIGGHHLFRCPVEDDLAFTQQIHPVRDAEARANVVRTR